MIYLGVDVLIIPYTIFSELWCCGFFFIVTDFSKVLAIIISNCFFSLFSLYPEFYIPIVHVMPSEIAPQSIIVLVTSFYLLIFFSLYFR